jgi:hypothetical protein
MSNISESIGTLNQAAALSLQWWTWAHARVAIPLMLVIVANATAIFVPIGKFLDERCISSLPGWLRWILVLPAALLFSALAEMLARFLFAAIELGLNHKLVFEPHFNGLIYCAWEPVIFVVAGAIMAPKERRYLALALLVALRIAVAGTNIYRDVSSYPSQLNETLIDPGTGAPLWWEAGANGLSVFFLILLVVSYRGRNLVVLRSGEPRV